MKKYFKQILWSREEIEKKCYELAQWVNETYKDSKDLVIIGLLKGSVPFLAQLIKDINIVHTLDFMTISSYKGKLKSNGNPKIVMDLDSIVESKDVLIVEDIIDTGRTIKKIKEILETRKPKSIKTLFLLNKPSGRIIEFKPDKFGFDAPNLFLVGFGLDYKDKFRGVPFIGEIDLTTINE